MKQNTRLSTQRGAALLEAFIAILLFSMGILGLMGLQATSMKNAAEVKYRVEAAYFANQIIAEMWADNPTALASYSHQPGGAGCNFAGGSGNQKVLDWIGNAATPGTLAFNLPGATAARQQIIIGANNTVTVTICWLKPGETVPHSYVGVAQIMGGA